jgi:PAS domain S-box-containing protein
VSDQPATSAPPGHDSEALRRRTAELLRSEENAARILHASPVGIAISQLDDGLLLDINDEFLRIIGYSGDEVAGRTSIELGLWVEPGQREAIARELVELGRYAPRPVPMRRKDGAVVTSLFSTSLIAMTGERYAVSWMMDITGRLHAEEARRESEQRFRDIVESLGDWYWEMDAAGRLTFSSEHCLQLLGRPRAALLGRSTLEFAAPDDAERQRRYLAAHGTPPRPVRDFEGWYLRPDGTRVCVAVSGVPVFGAAGALLGWRGVARDVTERKRDEQERRRMEAEVHQARRVESLGVLAGGIAHDFNNLLAAILGNAEMALQILPAGSEGWQLVEQMQAAGLHAAELTRQMLAYAGRGQFVTGRLDLSAAVREMAQLLAASVPKKIALCLELAEGLPAVEADAAQLRQVVMNLVINAVDAIGEREGRITVRTGVAAGDERDRRVDHLLGALDPQQQLVFFEVADTGGGIDPEALPRIFDPFYTTKFAGRGLGLAAVQGIVLRHRGAVAVRSDPEAGATLRVLFPATSAGPVTAVAGPAPALPQPIARDAWRGLTVLIVDDEEQVRAMASRMLRTFGLEVLAAADGREALGIAAAHPEIRAVLLDLMMPRMDGSETFQELRRANAGLPVILCSGFDVLESRERFAGLDFSGFLQKPFRLDDLAQALRRALGG